MVGILADLAYISFLVAWVKPAGEVVTSGRGLVIMVGFWRVFPFDFGSDAQTWELLARWVIGIALSTGTCQVPAPTSEVIGFEHVFDSIHEPGW